MGFCRVEHVNKLDDGRPQYRLGDAVLLRNTFGGRQVLEQVAAHPQYFSKTVLYEYASRINKSDPGPQWRILANAALNYARGEQLASPKDDELVVHLRMGDIKGYKGNVLEFVDYLFDVMARREGLSRITVVTALHFGRLFLKNHSQEDVAIAVGEETRKVEHVIDSLMSTGVLFKLRSHAEIDHDFCYLANAGHLVLGNGLFSLCAAMISGAQVIVPPWTRTGSPVGDKLLRNVILPRGANK